MPNPPDVEPVVATTQPNYPELEAFVEHASRDDVARLFERLRESLVALKGPRAEQAKKAIGALDRTEELIRRLLDIREGLAQAHQKRGKKTT